jgi:hypothetical protein
MTASISKILGDMANTNNNLITRETEETTIRIIRRIITVRIGETVKINTLREGIIITKGTAII